MNFWLHFKKTLAVLLFILFILFALSGVYASHNIDKLAYVISLGLDVRRKFTYKA